MSKGAAGIFVVMRTDAPRNDTHRPRRGGARLLPSGAGKSHRGDGCGRLFAPIPKMIHSSNRDKAGGGKPLPYKNGCGFCLCAANAH